MVSSSLGKPASPLPPDTGKGTGTERENDGLPWPLTPDANNLKNVSVEFLGEQKKKQRRKTWANTFTNKLEEAGVQGFCRGLAGVTKDFQGGFNDLHFLVCIPCVGLLTCLL